LFKNGNNERDTIAIEIRNKESLGSICFKIDKIKTETLNPRAKHLQIRGNIFFIFLFFYMQR